MKKKILIKNNFRLKFKVNMKCFFKKKISLKRILENYEKEFNKFKIQWDIIMQTEYDSKYE